MYYDLDIHTREDPGLLFILADDILFDCVTPIPSGLVIYKFYNFPG